MGGNGGDAVTERQDPFGSEGWEQEFVAWAQEVELDNAAKEMGDTPPAMFRALALYAADQHREVLGQIVANMQTDPLARAHRAKFGEALDLCGGALERVSALSSALADRVAGLGEGPSGLLPLREPDSRWVRVGVTAEFLDVA